MKQKVLKRNNKNFISIDTEITPKEEADLNFKINRNKARLIEKGTTPLYQLEDLFMSYQRGKNNTEQTIKYYQKVFRNFYRFVAYEFSEVESYVKLMKDERFEDEADVGKLLPIIVLEADDLDADYREYILDVLESSEQTLNNLFRGYRAIAYFAMERGYIDTRKIHIRDIDPPIKQVYTQEEINRLMRNPDKDNFLQYRDWVIIKFLLATGSRISSVANLKVGDVDFEENTITLNVQKNRQPIIIPMVVTLASVMREYIYNYRCDMDGFPLVEQYVFCNVYGKYADPVSLGKSIAEYNKAHNVQKTSVHLFRHTFAKRWIVEGGDVLSLQKMLGHRTLKMVQRYSNLYSTDIKPKAEKFAALNTVKTKSGVQKLTRRK